MHQPIKLYSFVPFDRGGRVRWLAHELGLPVEEHRLDYAGGEHRRFPHLGRHPFGQVPAIEIDGQTRWESVAICQSLAEQRPEAGITIPLAAPERPEYLSWLFFAASTFDSAAFQVFRYAALAPDEARRKEAQAVLLPLLVRLSRQLGDHDYLMGERFTLPDIVLGHAIQLLYLTRVLDEMPSLLKYRQRLASRPAAKRAGVFTPRPGARRPGRVRGPSPGHPLDRRWPGNSAGAGRSRRNRATRKA
jgi:glutathione S-transferase